MIPFGYLFWKASAFALLAGLEFAEWLGAIDLEPSRPAGVWRDTSGNERCPHCAGPIA